MGRNHEPGAYVETSRAISTGIPQEALLKGSSPVNARALVL